MSGHAGKGEPSDLQRIQRWMQSVIMHPGGLGEGVDSPEARLHLDIGHDEIERVIARSQALTSAERLEIYVDAYHERLLECLREEFPATRHALGPELFEALAFGYLQHDPSRSYTLGQLGARLPDFLGESRLHQRAEPDGASPTWADFVIELARFERLGREIFDGPGSEQIATLAVDELLAVPAKAWGEIGLRTVPCLRLVRFEHPVHAYAAALRRQEPVGPPPARPTLLAIYRRDYAIESLELPPEGFALLGALARGETLAGAIERAFALPGSSSASLVESELGQWFATWTLHRLLIGIERPSES
jgi:Putative DNA-binding domain